jgi:hypothetical protein
MQDGHVIVFPSARCARIDKMASTLEEAYCTILQFHCQAQHWLNSTLPWRLLWCGVDEDKIWSDTTGNDVIYGRLYVNSLRSTPALRPARLMLNVGKASKKLGEIFGELVCHRMSIYWFLWFCKYLYFIFNYTLYLNNYWLGSEPQKGQNFSYPQIVQTDSGAHSVN